MAGFYAPAVGARGPHTHRRIGGQLCDRLILNLTSALAATSLTTAMRRTIAGIPRNAASAIGHA
jgi:hypothetical protein